ncbi:hypothetical protein [Streptomyces sp. NRRL WC-3742]|uniref:hypothetical protein n=1 Tax=Streptomyces sp. NRRL WC-3742 TaxID=1463934 RepID=UPI0004CC4191|nr:hypothetical protein [Streptomyces sp. NRRL WC-3742]
MTTPQEPPPFLSLRTAVILLIAFVIGAVMGTLALLGGIPAAGATAAGLTGAGAAVPVLHKLVR